MDITEFEWLDPARVDAVEDPANGTPWLMLKSAEGEEDDTLSGDRMVKYVSASARRKYAQSGVAMPNGDFPIPDEGHLKSATGHLGGYTGDRSAAKRHIIKRAKALGLTHLLPEDWHVSKALGSQGDYAQVEFPSPDAEMGQTREMHPDAGPKSGNVEQDGGHVDPGSYGAGTHPDAEEGDGLGDTAPNKKLPLAQAKRQTRAMARKATEGGMQDEAEVAGDMHMEGDKAPNGAHEAAEAEDEAEGQTRRLKRKGGSNATDQQRREDAQTQKAKRKKKSISRKNADTSPGNRAWQAKDVELAAEAVAHMREALDLASQFESRERQEASKAVKQISAAVRKLSAVSPSNAAKEIENMTQEELDDIVNRRVAKAVKTARKDADRKAEKAAKQATKKAAKKAAKVEKSAGAAGAEDVASLAQRLANVEGQPTRPQPMLNGTGVAAAVQRGQKAEDVLKALRDQVDKEPEGSRSWRDAQAELTKGAFVLAEHERQATPGPQGIGRPLFKSTTIRPGARV